jgi:hypothetical protein
MNKLFSKVCKPILEYSTLDTEDINYLDIIQTKTKNDEKPDSLFPQKDILDNFIQDLHEQLENMSDEEMIPNSSEKKELVIKTHKSIESRISTEEKFWEYIDELIWADKDDKNISPIFMKAKMRSDLNNTDLEKFKEFLDKNVETLEAKFTLHGIFAGNMFTNVENGNKNKKDLLSHIVAKGSVTYSLMYEDPPFALYLVGEDVASSNYQSLYDCLP